jgi:hypothetical protein
MEKDTYYLDFLYGQYFTQLLRTKSTPTYVENKVLSDCAVIIRNYLLQFTEKLKKSVNEYKTNTDNSYMVWDRKYYEEQAKTRLDEIKQFENKIFNIKPKELLKEDLSSVSKQLEEAYPNHLPKSKVRENLLREWNKIKSHVVSN